MHITKNKHDEAVAQRQFGKNGFHSTETEKENKESQYLDKSSLLVKTRETENESSEGTVKGNQKARYSNAVKTSCQSWNLKSKKKGAKK